MGKMSHRTTKVGPVISIMIFCLLSSYIFLFWRCITRVHNLWREKKLHATYKNLVNIYEYSAS